MRETCCAGSSAFPGGRSRFRSTPSPTPRRATHRTIPPRCGAAWLRLRSRWRRFSCCLSFGELFAALHRRGGELGLWLVAADDEQEQMLLRRLVEGHVHEAP